MRKWKDLHTDIEWNLIPSGTKLTKFVASSEQNVYPYVVIHGFIDDNGNWYITSEGMDYGPKKD